MSFLSKCKDQIWMTKMCLNHLVLYVPYQLGTACGISDLTMAHFTTRKVIADLSVYNLTKYSPWKPRPAHKVEAAYQVFKKYVLDKGTYVCLSTRILLLSNTGGYAFRNGLLNTPGHRHVDLLAYVVDSLLNPHPEQAKETQHDYLLHKLWVHAMTSAIWVGKTEQVLALLKKYPEFLEKEHSAGSEGHEGSVSMHVLFNLFKTADEGVLTRFLQYPFLLSHPERGGVSRVFVHNDAAMRQLRTHGCLEYRPSRSHVPNVHDVIIEAQVRSCVAKLKEGKTAAQIARAYEAFKAYTRSQRFMEDVHSIAQIPFGEGVLAEALKALSPAAREAHLYHAIVGDGTLSCPGLLRRMEEASPGLRALFKEYIALVWLAIQETDHLLIFQSETAQLPTFDKEKELTEIRLHVLKRVLDIQHIYLGEAFITNAAGSRALNNDQAACKPGTLGHIINILTFIDDRVIVADTEVTPAFDANADLAHKLIAEDYQFLRYLIEKAYTGVENLKPLEDIFNLLSLQMAPAFSQSDYAAFFANKPYPGIPPEHLYKIRFTLQQFLGKLKAVLEPAEYTAYIALEDVLKTMRVYTLGGLISPILDKKRAAIPVIVEKIPTQETVELTVAHDMRLKV